jgi:DNA-directed RNA polymerase specialized sigma24 family protein
MNAWDTSDWNRVFMRTQDYLRNRIFGGVCDREMIEAWRNFHVTHEPIVRTMVAHAGLSGEQAEECAQDIWLDMLTTVPKLRSQLTRDAFLYWLSQLARAKAKLPRNPGQGHLIAGHCVDDENDMLTTDPRSSGRLEQATTGADPIRARLFQMSVIEEQPTEEVAQALGLANWQVELCQRRMLQRILSILIDLDARHPLDERPSCPTQPA